MEKNLNLFFNELDFYIYIFLDSVGSGVRALGDWSEGCEFKHWHCQAVIASPLIKTLNPFCSRGVVSWKAPAF